MPFLRRACPLGSKPPFDPAFLIFFSHHLSIIWLSLKQPSTFPTHTQVHFERNWKLNQSQTPHPRSPSFRALSSCDANENIQRQPLDKNNMEMPSMKLEEWREQLNIGARCIICKVWQMWKLNLGNPEPGRQEKYADFCRCGGGDRRLTRWQLGDTEQIQHHTDLTLSSADGQSLLDYSLFVSFIKYIHMGQFLQGGNFGCLQQINIRRTNQMKASEKRRKVWNSHM